MKATVANVVLILTFVNNWVFVEQLSTIHTLTYHPVVQPSLLDYMGKGTIVQQNDNDCGFLRSNIY